MPFIAKYFYIIASLLITGYLITVSQYIFNPLLAAFILALALKPLVNIFEKVKIPRILSTIFSIIIFILVILGVVLFFSVQLGQMDFEMASWQTKFNGVLGDIQEGITNIFGFSPEQQVNIFKKSFTTFLQNSTTLINTTLFFTTSFLSAFILFILSLFFLLYYRAFLVSFLYKVFQRRHKAKLQRILNKMEYVVAHYIFGLSFIIAIVGVLNSIGLLALGIKNAIFFGVFAAVLILIPYIGILIGSLLPTIFAFFTKDSLWYPVGVLSVFIVVQFLEGNFLTPNIVGRQVSINPFASILGLILGGMFLGLIGIVFALPVLAIVKIICDEVAFLEPLGFLIGNPPADLRK